MASAAPIIADLAAQIKAEGTDNFVVSILAAFEDEAAVSEYIAANCATEDTTGALTLFYAEMMGLVESSGEPADPSASLTLCTNADGVGTAWLEYTPPHAVRIVAMLVDAHTQSTVERAACRCTKRIQGATSIGRLVLLAWF